MTISLHKGRYIPANPLNVAEGWRLERVTAPSRLFGANGLRTGPDGRVYVAQVTGSQISALDPATEEQLLRQLKVNTRGRTVIMITHRLAPLAIADRVALVMDGRIERIGPPTDVMAYARIRMAEASRGQSAAGTAAHAVAQAMLA